MMFTDSTLSDFGQGTFDAACYLANTAGGELMLGPTVGAEFNGTELPTGWSQHIWTGSAPVVADGLLTVNGAMAYTDTSFGPGRVLEFRATFGSQPFQHVGFGGTVVGTPYVPFNGAPWIMFSTSNDGAQVYARVLPAGSGDYNTGNDKIPVGDYRGSPHTYRIEWQANSITFYVDGELRATVNQAIPDQMRVAASDYNVASPALSVDWLRMSPYASPCVFTSRVFDASQAAQWLDLSWFGTQPEDTGVAFATRTGDTATPDENWSAWADVNSPIASPNGRYLQYQATLTTSNNNVTPRVDDVEITYDFPTAVKLASFTASAEGTAVRITWETTMELNNLGFNLYRSTTIEGPYVRLNTSLIPPQFPGEILGGVYTWLDETVEPGHTYYYQLEDIEIGDIATLYGPVSVTLAATTPTSVHLLHVDGQTGGGAVGVLALLTLVGWPKTKRKQQHKSR